MDLKEVRENAKVLFKGTCRVCKQCDGRACIGETPGMGGIGTGTSFHNNVSALKNVRLNMRLVHDAKEPDISTEILGFKLAFPLFIAPIGGISYNMQSAIAESEYANAIIEGAKECGIMGTTGDGVPEEIHTCGFAAITNANGFGVPFIKPWESVEFNEKLEKAFASNCSVIGMDIDAAGLIILKTFGRPVSPKSPTELAAIVDKVHAKGKKFILKGVMTVADALAAVEAKVDAIVVSNHGGRVLDYTPGTAEVLPLIAKAVKGKITIIADGGIRDGFDILKVLALGADAVMIGRTYSIAAIGGGKEGVVLYTESLKVQLTQAMVLTGCANIKDIDSDVVSIT